MSRSSSPTCWCSTSATSSTTPSARRRRHAEYYKLYYIIRRRFISDDCFKSVAHPFRGADDTDGSPTGGIL